MVKKKSILEFFKSTGSLLLEAKKAKQPVVNNYATAAANEVIAYAKEKGVAVTDSYVNDVVDSFKEDLFDGNPSGFVASEKRKIDDASRRGDINYVHGNIVKTDLRAKSNRVSNDIITKSTSTGVDAKGNPINITSRGLTTDGNTEKKNSITSGNLKLILDNDMVKTFIRNVDEFGSDQMINELPDNLRIVKDNFGKIFKMDKITGVIEFVKKSMSNKASDDQWGEVLKSVIWNTFVKPFNGAVKNVVDGNKIKLNGIKIGDQFVSYDEMVKNRNSITSDQMLAGKLDKSISIENQLLNITSPVDAKQFVLSLDGKIPDIIDAIQNSKSASFYTKDTFNSAISKLTTLHNDKEAGKPVATEEIADVVYRYVHKTSSDSVTTIGDIDKKFDNKKYDTEYSRLMDKGDVKLPKSLADSIITFINRVVNDKMTLTVSQATSGQNTSKIIVDSNAKDKLRKIQLSLGVTLQKIKGNKTIQEFDMTTDRYNELVEGVTAVALSIATMSRKDSEESYEPNIASMVRAVFTKKKNIDVFLDNIAVPGYIQFTINQGEVKDPAENMIKMFVQANNTVSPLKASDKDTAQRRSEKEEALDGINTLISSMCKTEAIIDAYPGEVIDAVEDRNDISKRLNVLVDGWIMSRLNSIYENTLKVDEDNPKTRALTQADKKFLIAVTSGILDTSDAQGGIRVYTGVIVQHLQDQFSEASKNNNTKNMSLSKELSGDYAKDSFYILKQYQKVLNSEKPDVQLGAIVALLRNDEAWKPIAEDLMSKDKQYLWSMYIDQGKDQNESKYYAMAKYVLTDLLTRPMKEQPEIISRNRELFSLVSRNTKTKDASGKTIEVPSADRIAIQKAILNRGLSKSTDSAIVGLFKRDIAKDGDKAVTFAFPNTSLMTNMAIASFIVSGGDDQIFGGTNNGMSYKAIDQSKKDKFVAGVIAHINSDKFSVTDDVLALIPEDKTINDFATRKQEYVNSVNKVAMKLMNHIDIKSREYMYLMGRNESGGVSFNVSDLKNRVVDFVMIDMLNMKESINAPAPIHLTKLYDALEGVVNELGVNPITVYQLIKSKIKLFDEVQSIKVNKPDGTPNEVTPFNDVINDDSIAKLKELLPNLKFDKNTGVLGKEKNSLALAKKAIAMADEMFGISDHPNYHSLGGISDPDTDFVGMVRDKLLASDNIYAAKRALSVEHKYKVMVGDQFIEGIVPYREYVKIADTDILGDKTDINSYNKLGKFERFVVAYICAKQVNVPIEKFIPSNQFNKQLIEDGVAIISRGDSKETENSDSFTMSLRDLTMKVQLVHKNLRAPIDVTVTGIDVNDIRFDRRWPGYQAIVDAGSKTGLLQAAVHSFNMGMQDFVGSNTLSQFQKKNGDVLPFIKNFKTRILNSRQFKDAWNGARKMIGTNTPGVIFDSITDFDTKQELKVLNSIDGQVTKALTQLKDIIESAYKADKNAAGQTLNITDDKDTLLKEIDQQLQLVNVNIRDIMNLVEKTKLTIAIPYSLTSIESVLKIDGSYINRDYMTNIDGTPISDKTMNRVRSIMANESKMNFVREAERYAHSSRGIKENKRLQIWENESDFKKFWEGLTHTQGGKVHTESLDVKSIEDLGKFIQNALPTIRFNDKSGALQSLITAVFDSGVVGGTHTKQSVERQVKYYSSIKKGEDVTIPILKSRGLEFDDKSTRIDDKENTIEDFLNRKLDRNDYAKFISTYTFITPNLFDDENRRIVNMVARLIDKVTSSTEHDPKDVISLRNEFLNTITGVAASIDKKLTFKKVRNESVLDAKPFNKELRDLVNTSAFISMFTDIGIDQATGIDLIKLLSNAVNGEMVPDINKKCMDAYTVMGRNLQKIQGKLAGTDTTISLANVLNEFIKIDVMVKAFGDTLFDDEVADEQESKDAGKSDYEKLSDINKGTKDRTKDVEKMGKVQFNKMIQELAATLSGVSSDDPNENMKSITHGGRSAESLVKFKSVYNDEVVAKVKEYTVTGKMATLAGSAKPLPVSKLPEFLHAQMRKFGDPVIAELKTSVESRLLDDPKAAKEMTDKLNAIEGFFKSHGRGGMSFDAADMTLVKMIMSANTAIDDLDTDSMADDLNNFINDAKDMVIIETRSLLKSPFPNFTDDDKLMKMIEGIFIRFIKDKANREVKSWWKQWSDKGGARRIGQEFGSVVGRGGRHIADLNQPMNQSTHYGHRASLVEAANRYFNKCFK